MNASEKIAKAISDAESVIANDDSRVEEIVKLPLFEYDRHRAALAKEMGVRGKTLDEVVEKARKHLERLEHSNGQVDHPTGSGTSDRSNGCSNEMGVRTLEELEQSARTIVEATDHLTLVRDAIVQGGYAGDPNPVVLLYVAGSSRLTAKPVNVHVAGPSAAGKNFAINSATRFIPEEGMLKLSAMSPKALIHGDDDLRHKVVVLSECDSLAHLEGNAATLIRSIIEESKTNFDVVERDPESGRSFTRRVSKEGPTGLITSGVGGLEFQIGTRVLNDYISDTPEQTRAILHAEAAIASGTASGPDPKRAGEFIDFQRWLALQPEAIVVVPFASILARVIPAGEVRMRRDFKQMLIVTQTIALLNRRHRASNSAGAIIADFADYGWARTLLLSSFRSIVAGGLTDAVRKTVEAMPEEGEVSEAALVQQLGLAKSTIHYRVIRALRGGWLTNLEHRKGYAYRLIRGTPLPEDASPLPTVEKLKELFEQGGDSNGYSNGPQTIGRVRENEQAFECSNGSPSIAANSRVDPDSDALREAEIDRLAALDATDGAAGEDDRPALAVEDDYEEVEERPRKMWGDEDDELDEYGIPKGK